MKWDEEGVDSLGLFCRYYSFGLFAGMLWKWVAVNCKRGDGR